MSLKSLLALVDDKLESVFNQKPYDPTKDRKKVIKGIERTRTQFTEAGPGDITLRGRSWFSAKNNVVRFSPGFSIGGKDTHHLPRERFPQYLEHLKAAVEAGELDDVIASKDGRSGRTARRTRRATA